LAFVDEVVVAQRRVARSVLLTLAVAIAVALATAAIVYAIVAIPLYTLAQSDPSGLDRPFIRDGFFKVGLPVGGAIGLVVGALVGVWYGRGGRLPAHRSFEE
jgi:hypothetical protein